MRVVFIGWYYSLGLDWRLGCRLFAFIVGWCGACADDVGGLLLIVWCLVVLCCYCGLVDELLVVLWLAIELCFCDCLCGW